METGEGKGKSSYDNDLITGSSNRTAIILFFLEITEVSF